MSGFFKTTAGELQDFHRVLAEQAKLTREEVVTARTYPEFTAWFAGHIRNLMKDIVLYQGPCDRWQVDDGHLYVSFVRMTKGSASRIVLRDVEDMFYLAPADEDWRVNRGVLYVNKARDGGLKILAHRLKGRSETIWDGPGGSWSVAGGQVYIHDDFRAIRAEGAEPLFDGEQVQDVKMHGDLVVGFHIQGRKARLIDADGAVLYQDTEKFDWTVGPDGIHVLHGTKVSSVGDGKAMLVHEFPAWFLTKINGPIVDWHVFSKRVCVYDPAIGLWCNEDRILPPLSLSHEWYMTRDSVYVELADGDNRLIACLPQPE